MSYFVFVLFFCLLMGLVAVAANPAPLYGAVGLVFSAMVGCVVLLWLGGSFISLMLFLIYLGGMLVVFGYSVALAADPYPETWGSWAVGLYEGVYLLLVVGVIVLFGGPSMLDWFSVSGVDCDEFNLVRVDSGGVCLMYSWGGGFLLVSGLGLLLALFVALEVSRGLSRGGLRAV